MPYIKSCNRSYTSYELCPVLEKQFGKPATYILQLLHYWLLLENLSQGIIRDELQWFYNTHSNWLKKLNQNKIYISLSSVRRGLEILENQGVVLARCFNVPGNNINSYTIDYDQLECLIGKVSLTRLQRRPCPVLEQQLQPHIIAHSNKKFPVFNEQTYGHKPVQMSRPINRYITKKTLNNFPSDQNLDEMALPHANNADQAFQQQEKEKINIPEKMICLWNEIIEENKTSVALTPQRARYLITAFNQIFNRDLEEWIAFCCKIASSKFLMGETSTYTWRIDLDWALNFNKTQLIREGNRYTFGDRLVAYNAQTVKKSVDKPQSSTEVLGELTEKPDALKIRLNIQEILKRRYCDDNAALYAAWFKDSHIDIKDKESDVRTCYLYVKSRFIKNQLHIRYEDLCEALFTEIRVGLPKINAETSESLTPLDSGNDHTIETKTLFSEEINSELLDENNQIEDNQLSDSFRDEALQTRSYPTELFDPTKNAPHRNISITKCTHEETGELLKTVKHANDSEHTSINRSGADQCDTHDSDHDDRRALKQTDIKDVVMNKAGSRKICQNDQPKSQSDTENKSRSMLHILHDINVLSFRKRAKSILPESLYLKWFHDVELNVEKGRALLYVSSHEEKQHIESDLSIFSEQLPLDVLIKHDSSKEESNQLQNEIGVDTPISSNDREGSSNDNNLDSTFVSQEISAAVDPGRFLIDEHQKKSIYARIIIYHAYIMVLNVQKNSASYHVYLCQKEEQKIYWIKSGHHAYFFVFLLSKNDAENCVYQPPTFFYKDRHKDLKPLISAPSRRNIMCAFPVDQPALNPHLRKRLGIQAIWN